MSDRERFIRDLMLVTVRTLIAEDLLKLFVASGRKVNDKELIELVKLVSTDLKEKYGYLKINEISTIVSNAITGEYGPVTYITVNLFYQWINKYVSSKVVANRNEEIKKEQDKIKEDMSNYTEDSVYYARAVRMRMTDKTAASFPLAEFVEMLKKDDNAEK